MISDILVCLNGSNNDTITAAATFALRHNARLTGLYILIDNVNRYYAYEALSVEVMEQLIAEEQERADKSMTFFAQLARDVGCDFFSHSVREGRESKAMMLMSDYIFASGVANSGETHFGGLGLISHLILDTGRPVVIVPNEWKSDHFGQNISLGWNETPESARAMHAALPLMRSANSVNVVTVDIHDIGAELSEEASVERYLSRNDVNTTLYLEETDDILSNVSDVLLDHVSRHQRDLLVVGGYSHSRLREMIFGGTTRYLIHDATIPLLLVH